jgi:hypothetical protein
MRKWEVIFARALSSPLKKSTCCGWLVFSPPSFSAKNFLNMTCGHSFDHFPSQASLEKKPLILATPDFFNGLLGPTQK